MQGVTKESTPEIVGVAAASLVFPSDVTSADAAGSFLQSDQHADVECEFPQTVPDIVLELQRKIAQLETQLADSQEKLSEAEKEKEVLLGHQFCNDKIKDDNAAVLFYTGFPSYDALISFYNYIKPKLSKMQYWKGENLVKESQFIKWMKIRVNLDLQGSLLILRSFYWFS